MNNLHSLKNKNIILAVTGSIAAYKSVSLLRLFIKAGADVKVIMTPSAEKFVNKLTFATLSKHEVYSEVSNGEAWNNHVELGLWADIMVIAPLTANTLAKMANGIADTMVQAVYLSAKCPIYFAPAMDLDMWKHPSTVANIKKVKSYGNIEIAVGHGELASGLVGAGRMAEPEEIIDILAAFFNAKSLLKNKKILITGGPTQEKIDPVRFISNHSSGRMGVELANACANQGAEVIFVAGPLTTSEPINPAVHQIHITSAQEMYEACVKHFKSSNVAIMAAAVADYTPMHAADKKIKKKEDDMAIPLKRTIDIAATLGKTKTESQLLIGFALETNNELENAKAKVKKKNFDFIVLNSMKDKGAGFKHTTNKVTIIHKTGNHLTYDLKEKKEVAKDIITEIEKIIT